MFKFNDRGPYEDSKRQVALMIQEVRQASLADADYLQEHMVFDDKTMTFRYTGDDRYASLLGEEMLN